MATGDNASTLQTIGGNWDSRAGASPTRRPRDYFEGRSGKIAFNGTGAQTVFNIPHGIVNDAGNGIIPTYYDANGIDAVSNAAKLVTATTTNIVVTYTAAPASGTNNVNLVWIAAR
jgi:hypothetical protein